MGVSALERDILVWIADRNPHLASELSQATVVKREHAAGFFSYLREHDVDWDHPPVDGPFIESPLVDGGGGSILWLSGGKPACLEVYTHGANFTEELTEYELLDAASTV